MSDQELLANCFSSDCPQEFVIEARHRHEKNNKKRILGRFPLGFPDFEDTKSKKWNLTKYEDNQETGEPGGWMIEDNPGSQTHKGTPASMDDIKNLVILHRNPGGQFSIAFVDEAFNFRPTIRHKVYTLEEAEMLMSAKQKPKMAAALKAQFDANEKKLKAGEGDGLADSDSEEKQSNNATPKKKKAKKQEDITDLEEARAARTLREVIATDALIEEIKPGNVEDWEYDEEADDDDVNMGEGDFAEEEQYELEAEYKKYAGSESSEDELDEKGKELKKLIKKGPTLPPPSTAPVPTSEPAVSLNAAEAESPKEITKQDLLQFLKTSGPLPLKDLIQSFKRSVVTKDQHRQFIKFVKELAFFDDRGESKVVVLRKGL